MPPFREINLFMTELFLSISLSPILGRTFIALKKICCELCYDDVTKQVNRGISWLEHEVINSESRSLGLGDDSSNSPQAKLIP